MTTPPTRKPPQSAPAPHRRARLPLRPVREAIWEAACALAVDGHSQELSAILAGRFHTSQRIIDLVLVTEGMRHQRTAATLRTGMLAALQQASASAAAVEEEMEDVA